MALKAVSARSAGEILALCKSANPQGIAIGGEHRNALAHMLGGFPVHYCT